MPIGRAVAMVNPQCCQWKAEGFAGAAPEKTKARKAISPSGPRSELVVCVRATGSRSRTERGAGGKSLPTTTRAIVDREHDSAMLSRARAGCQALPRRSSKSEGGLHFPANGRRVRGQRGAYAPVRPGQPVPRVRARRLALRATNLDLAARGPVGHRDDCVGT